MHVRASRATDVGALADILQASVKGLAGEYYSSAQVQAWMAVLPDVTRIKNQTLDGRKTFIAETSSEGVCGLIDLEACGHIDYLYIRPEKAGQGLATIMYNHLEAYAIRHGMTRLYTEASEHARRFFLAKGFSELHRRDFEVGGVSIHNYAMEKWVGDGSTGIESC